MVVRSSLPEGKHGAERIVHMFIPCMFTLSLGAWCLESDSRIL